MNNIIQEMIAQVKIFTGQEMSAIKVNGFISFACFIALCPYPHRRIASAQML